LVPIKERKYATYSKKKKEDLNAAVASLSSMSLRQAAHYFEIPFKTLHDQRRHKSHVGAGKPVV
jgi:hypothetical protein